MADSEKYKKFLRYLPLLLMITGYALIFSDIDKFKRKLYEAKEELLCPYTVLENERSRWQFRNMASSGSKQQNLGVYILSFSWAIFILVAIYDYKVNKKINFRYIFISVIVAIPSIFAPVTLQKSSVFPKTLDNYKEKMSYIEKLFEVANTKGLLLQSGIKDKVSIPSLKGIQMIVQERMKEKHDLKSDNDAQLKYSENPKEIPGYLRFSQVKDNRYLVQLVKDIAELKDSDDIAATAAKELGISSKDAYIGELKDSIKELGEFWSFNIDDDISKKIKRIEGILVTSFIVISFVFFHDLYSRNKANGYVVYTSVAVVMLMIACMLVFSWITRSTR